MEISLKNKTALVCGSTGGIGKAIATQLSNCGANIVLLARNTTKLEAVKNSLDTKKSQTHTYYQADFSDNDSVQESILKIKENHTIDILINNTGGPPAGTAIDADINAYLDAFKLHLINNQLLANSFVEGMKENNWGRIINIISTSVKIPLKGLGVSNTVRGAVGNWSKTIATELAPFGITVNNILPGATETERLSSIISNKASKLGVSEADVTKTMLGQVPAGRFGKPEEPGFAAAFLASDFASYITGTNVVVDGGRTGCL